MKNARDGPKKESKSDLLQLKQIFRRYVNYVYTIYLRLITNIKAAEDATVETFMCFSRELARWLSDKHIRESLRYLAFNASLKRLGSCKRKAEEMKLDNKSVRHTIACTLSEENNQTVEADVYESLVGQLPKAMRIAYVLRDKTGLSDYAIAEHLRLSEAEVRRLLHQARMELRRLWLTKD